MREYRVSSRELAAANPDVDPERLRSGDRDDSEELNWLREGHHYGFPWRMGLNETPQQFADYDPAEDLLLNPASYAVPAVEPGYDEDADEEG